MTTAQQERKQRAAEKARTSRRYEYQPVMLDQFDPRTKLAPGDVVVKIQPHGCPRNGTMGMCFVGTPETGEFIGLVCVNSLKAVPPVRGGSRRDGPLLREGGGTA